MLSREKKARGTAEQRVVEMAEIFKPHEECEKPRKVLIEGKPGMGKTTYCNKVAYDWATKKHKAEDYFPEFELLLLLKCRDVAIGSDLWDAIDDQLLPREVQAEEREKFFKFISQNQSKVLLVFDGLDELPTSKLPKSFSEVISGKTLPRCYLVVTARNEAGIAVRKDCDALLEVEGFSPEDAKEFILKYFKGKEDMSHEFLKNLSIDSRLEELTANPLNTALLCLIFEDFQGKLPQRRTQLYLEIVQCVLIRYRKKKGLSVDIKDVIEIYEDQLKLLGSIALNGLFEDNMYFEEKKLSSENADLPEFGFLSAQPGGSKRRPCMCYCFTHKSFEEFFAGYYLCCQLVSEETSPFILVNDTTYFRELGEVLKFTCGLLPVRSKESAVALIQCIANEVNEEDEMECLPVALECIKECKTENSYFHIELTRTFGACLEVQEAYFDEDHIEGEGIDDAADVLAAVLETNSTLTNLNLCYNNIGPTGAVSLATALEENTTLTNLELSFNHPGPAGAESLAKALKTNTTLTNLVLSFNNLGPADAESLATALKTNTTLANLNVSANNLGPAGAESLATALKTNTTLPNLDVSANNLGPAGAESLATALKTNTTLTNLDLSGNDFGPAGVESLATALKTNTTLTNLDLSDNGVGPASNASRVLQLLKQTQLGAESPNDCL